MKSSVFSNMLIFCNISILSVVPGGIAIGMPLSGIL
jgi:hypothetical protein